MQARVVGFGVGAGLQMRKMRPTVTAAGQTLTGAGSEQLYTNSRNKCSELNPKNRRLSTNIVLRGFGQEPSSGPDVTHTGEPAEHHSAPPMPAKSERI